MFALFSLLQITKTKIALQNLHDDHVNTLEIQVNEIIATLLKGQIYFHVALSERFATTDSLCVGGHDSI